MRDFALAVVMLALMFEGERGRSGETAIFACSVRKEPSLICAVESRVSLKQHFQMNLRTLAMDIKSLSRVDLFPRCKGDPKKEA